MNSYIRLPKQDKMKSLRIHILQHVAFEGPGCLLNWFKQHNCTLTYTRFYEADAQLPKPADFDRLVIMGGPMGVYETRNNFV